MSANYTPEQNEYKNLTPFKSWLLLQINTWGQVNFPFVESDFDELTNYGMMQKLMGALNDVISNMNDVEEDVTNIFNAFTELQTYVNDYFDNLDVEDEINAKLDDMAQDGTLENLIGAYIQPRIDAQNTEIANIRNMVENVASGSPLVATSTSGMTDTSRVYVNTTDGKWYYYNGSAWTIGGTYQSSGISNNSIDVLMLDSDLQSNFLMDFSTPIAKGDAYTGYYRNNGTLVDDSVFKNYHVSLTNGETYVFSGQNAVNLATLVIKDSNNNVVYGSNPNTDSSFVGYMFKVKENGLTAYISMYSSYGGTSLRNDLYGSLRVLTNVFNQLKYTDSIVNILNVENAFLSATSLASEENRLKLLYTSYTGPNIKIYQMSKGRTYKIKSWNWSNVCGLLIAPLNLGDIIYASSTENIGGTHTEVDYQFTATQDGYIIISTLPDTITYPYSIEIVNEGVDINVMYNNLIDKKIGIDGDSIINGAGNNSIGYCDIIASNNNMTKSKKSVGGGTIASNTYSSGNPRHWICQSVLTIDSDCDYVVVNGGFNDYANSVPLGEFISSYTSEIDSSTFYGGLETLCRNLISRFATKKIAFCTNHNINNALFSANSRGLTMQDYIDATYKVCEKYGIKIIDVGKNTHLDTAISTLKSSYTKDADGVHPNANGYNYFYVDYVFNELNSL